MRNFQDTFETRKRSFISGFSICMTVRLGNFQIIFVNYFSENIQPILNLVNLQNYIYSDSDLLHLMCCSNIRILGCQEPNDS